MNNVYNSLVSQYGSGNIAKTSNGTYEVSYNGAKIIVPQNLSKNAYVVSYTPGFGETSVNRSEINKYFTNNGMDNAILVIASSSGNGPSRYSEMGYEMLNSLGCNTKGVITTGFSVSAPGAVNEATNFSKNHPNIPTTCISIDGTTAKPHLYYTGSPSDAYNGVNPTGAGDNLTIITVDGQFDHLSQTAKFANNGITSYNLSTTTENYTDNGGNCHDGASYDVMQFIVPYILGKKDKVNSRKNYYLRDASGKTVDISFLRTNLNESRTSSNSNNNNNSNNSNNSNKNTTNNNNKAVTLSNKEKTTPKSTYQNVIDRHSELASLSELKLLNMSSSSSNYISSDLQYVCDSMNSVRNVIKSSDSYANIKQMSSQISGGIFSIISSYINYYMDVVSNLYNKLSLETEAIVSYAQYIVDLDNSLKNKDLGALGGNPTSPTYDNGGSGGGGGADNAPIYDNDGSDSDSTESAPLDDDEDAVEYIYDDDHKMLVKTDGNKIVKITHKYKLNNIRDYKALLEKIYASFENPDVIESVTLNGNYINVVLKDSYCATLTLDDINNMAKEV